ncbi:hypothetical protein ERHA55_52430 (plasmid) [Erwinia rhapontici]|nr:hypothetical protein ERHA55_52430 [Erwinia rhapontici]
MKNQATVIPLVNETTTQHAQIIPLNNHPAPKTRRRYTLRPLFQRIIPGVCGMILLLGVWQIAALYSTGFPGPLSTWQAAVTLFADPFYNAGPNDQGIGWNVLASLQRVAIGLAWRHWSGSRRAFCWEDFCF